MSSHLHVHVLWFCHKVLFLFWHKFLRCYRVTSNDLVLFRSQLEDLWLWMELLYWCYRVSSNHLVVFRIVLEDRWLELLLWSSSTDADDLRLMSLELSWVEFLSWMVQELLWSAHADLSRLLLRSPSARVAA